MSEENKAAEMVEKRCSNCIYSKCNLSSFCVICSDKSKFVPSRAAIDEKIEELREQTVGKQNLNSKAKEMNLSDIAKKICASCYPVTKEERIIAIEVLANAVKERADMLELLKECYKNLIQACSDLCEQDTNGGCGGCKGNVLKAKINKMIEKVEGK